MGDGTRKTLGRWKWLIFALVVCTGGGIWWWTRPPRINLLIITLDTTRADRLGAWGGPADLTPVLDDLAKQSVVFERAFAPVPITLPSHASLFTGLYPPEHGLRLNNGVARLNSEIPVLAQLLQHQGYRTGAFIGAFVLDKQFGLDRGFDYYDDNLDAGEGHSSGDGHNHKMRIGERVVDSALGWLRGRSEPFFCWVHLFDPHTPYSAREELFGEKYRDRPYDAGIAYVDGQVGRLLDRLKKNGLDERTIIVVVGDHGESLGEHQERTHGYTIYDATVHVPLIIRLPGTERPVRRISTPVSLVDVLPTLADALQFKVPATCSGRTLLPACRGADLPVRGCYSESDHPFEEGGAAPLRSLIVDNWKYIRSPKPELYDRQADPRELQNLAAQKVAEVQHFDEMLRDLESGFVLQDAPTVVMSPHDKRKLVSLGYTSGITTTKAEVNDQLPDIKDLLPHFNAYTDAQGLMGAQDFTGAAKTLNGVVKAAPRYFQAWYNLGVCEQLLGHLPEAEAAFLKAVEIDGNAWAHLALSKVYLARGEPAKAVPHLETAVSLQPELIDANFLLGEALRQQGKTDQARQQFERVLELNPEFEPARKALQSLR